MVGKLFAGRRCDARLPQGRDELLYSNVKGRNPFKDKRVRQALYQAIDIEALKTQTMRGLAQPTGVILPSPGLSTPELEKRLPFDRAAAAFAGEVA